MGQLAPEGLRCPASLLKRSGPGKAYSGPQATLRLGHQEPLSLWREQRCLREQVSLRAALVTSQACRPQRLEQSTPRAAGSVRAGQAVASASGPSGLVARDCQDGGAWGEGLGVAPPPRESCPSCFRPPWGPMGRGAEDMFASARGGLPKVWNRLSKEQFLFFFRPPTVAHGSSQASG